MEILKKRFVMFVLIAMALSHASNRLNASEKTGSQAFADANGLHGTVTSITRFAPFDLSDANTDAERDLAFDYIEVTTASKARMKLIHRGASDYLIGEEVCLIFRSTSYGGFPLGDLLEKDDPARKALPLSKIRVEADGFIVDLPKGFCMLCCDEKGLLYVVSTGSTGGSCKRWQDDDGIRHIRIEDDNKNSAEASDEKGCIATKGSGICFQATYREY